MITACSFRENSNSSTISANKMSAEVVAAVLTGIKHAPTIAYFLGGFAGGIAVGFIIGVALSDAGVRQTITDIKNFLLGKNEMPHAE